MNWPAWEVALLADFLHKEPSPGDRVEVAIAQITTLYYNMHRKRGTPPYKISDFLLYRDAWKQEEKEPEESPATFALSFGMVKRRG